MPHKRKKDFPAQTIHVKAETDNTLNKNTILYAHGRLDKTMFGSLDNLFDSNWLANTNNHIISISTEDQTTKWQIFSIYHIPVTNDYIQTNFESDEEFMSFIDKIKSRSNYNFNINFTESDNILTLSTCYKNNSKERLVIHAKRDHYEVHPKC